MSAIAVHRVSKFWGATKAVDDISFDAAVGKLLVLFQRQFVQSFMRAGIR